MKNILETLSNNYQVSIIGNDIISGQKMAHNDGQAIQNVILNAFVAQFLEKGFQVVLSLTVRRRGSLAYFKK